MFLSANRLLDALVPAIAALQGSDGAGGNASNLQGIVTALGLLGARERGGAGAVQVQLRDLAARLERWAGWLPASSDLRRELDTVRSDAVRASGEKALSMVESDWRSLLRRIETIAGRLHASPDVDAATASRLVTELAEWEARDLAGQLGGTMLPAAADDAIDPPRLTAYLRDRFGDPDITVTTFRALPGGFGKQTILFGAKGRDIDGDFVIRRDMPGMFPDTDCHHVHREFRMIRAAHARGFPAPQAVWVDTEHRLLPGGDFLVMRRAPGVAGGSVSEAGTAIPADLARTLAQILAKLHALPPMPELADLSDTVRADLWDVPLETCVRRYLEGWRRQFELEPHLPSPATAALFDWLIANIPAAPGKPVLLHGDMGFHNFLFDEGRLTAVLDWEFAHLGDPCEDLAYARNTLGSALDWPSFLAAYREAGGAPVDSRRLHFFQVWGHLRNAAASNLVTAKFANGTVHELKMVLLPHFNVPMFLREAQRLIERGPEMGSESISTTKP